MIDSLKWAALPTRGNDVLFLDVLGTTAVGIPVLPGQVVRIVLPED